MSHAVVLYEVVGLDHMGGHRVHPLLRMGHMFTLVYVGEAMLWLNIL